MVSLFLGMDFRGISLHFVFLILELIKNFSKFLFNTVKSQTSTFDYRFNSTVWQPVQDSPFQNKITPT